MRLRVRVTLVLLLVNAGILGALAVWAWLDESQREADDHRRRGAKAFRRVGATQPRFVSAPPETGPGQVARSETKPAWLASL